MREGRKETGLTDLVAEKVISLSNRIDYGKHYVSVGVLIESKTGEPYEAEPVNLKIGHGLAPIKFPKMYFYRANE